MQDKLQGQTSELWMLLKEWGGGGLQGDIKSVEIGHLDQKPPTDHHVL